MVRVLIGCQHAMAGRLMDLIVAAQKEAAKPDPLGDAHNKRRA